MAYQQQKQKVLQLFQSALSLPQVSKNADTEKRLKEAETHLAEGKLFVVVCGEFKQGKSSLLNALLNEPDLFPVDVDITTNLVTTITYGQREKITVVVGEAGKQAAKEIQRSEIPDYVTEQRNQKNARKAKLLIIESPNPQLREGLVLVDTPGVGSLSAEHTAATYAFIPNADAILFVSDAFAPLSAKELEFIQDTIVPHCQNLIFVVTKIDKVSGYKTVVENNLEKLATVLGRPSSEIPIIPVSSKLKLEYLLSQNTEDLEDSQFASLETQLWQLISQQRGQLLLLRALSELGRVIAEIKQPIQVEWEAYQENNQENLDAWENQFQDAKLRLQNLLENNATWRSQLSDGLQDIRTQILEQLQDGFTAIRRQSSKYLDDRVLLESPEQIASLLEADIDSLMSNLGQQLGYLSANLQAQMEAVTNLSLNSFEASSLERQKTQFTFEDIQGKKPGMAGKLMQMTRNATFNMSAAGTIGGVAGAAIGSLFGGVGAIPGQILGAAVGGTIAGIVGLVSGAKEGLDQVKEKTKHTVSIVIKQFIDDSQIQCSRALNKAIKELETYLRDDFLAQIKREKDNSDRTLRSLQDARKLSQEQGVQRAKELQVQLGQLNQVQAAVEQLAKIIISSSTAELSSEAPTPAPQATVNDTPKQTVTAGADSGDWANG
ncbi:dynamin [Scytonema sp. UIC 10036]|uniref:dynamin family protein n=1 Tax=Scytonema sp. UIC 10036 TaxID=2304196 RepID=UPI0012DA9A3A|nr:dynamin family protein [Scytonema sp. UIC 10036]MUG96847.1 dynamin [Scytonema sp. UIC 10036]